MALPTGESSLDTGQLLVGDLIEAVAANRGPRLVMLQAGLCQAFHALAVSLYIGCQD